ncbi:MAG: tRNA 2-thiouridine(34) synthase MnmA [Thermoleophilia bacterium]
MNDLLREHFDHPRNAGEPDRADGSGEAGDSGCGAVIRLYVSFDDENIGEAYFLASGSSAAIAAGSLLTELIRGKGWRQAASLPAELLEEMLGVDEPVNASRAAKIKNAAFFAIAALHAAMEDSIARGTFPLADSIDDDAVLVAMSGGVDSSVACLLEKQRGRNVVGVTLRLWSDPASGGDGSVNCCSPESIRDARSICHHLGIPHLAIDCTDEFREAVVDDFVSEYLNGRTPNPCARCNGIFRFPKLVELARGLGAAEVATGHYARIVEKQGRRLIARGADRSKDQSYVLWGIDAALLDSISFPLGGLSKEQTRRLAREAGLHVHNRPESQEICFIPDNDYRRFLRGRSSELPGEGEILDVDGARMGTHTGYTDYTIGQRHGLGVSAPEPVFVIATIPEKNQVIVGGRDQLAIRQLTIDRVNWFVDMEEYDFSEFLEIQLRYNSLPVAGTLTPKKNNALPELRILLQEQVYGVATGQSAVIYSGEAIVAAGVIKTTSVVI